MHLLLVSDYVLLRKSLLRVVKTFPSVSKVSEASDGLEALTTLSNQYVDVALLDVSMPVIDGFRACDLIIKKSPHVKIIILTQHDSERLMIHFFNKGVHSYLLKNIEIEELELAINTVMRGTRYFSKHVAESLQKHIHEFDKPSMVGLRKKEIELIEFLQLGLSSKEIAEKLGLSLKTVNSYREDLLKKTNTKNAAELVSFALHNGLIR